MGVWAPGSKGTTGPVSPCPASPIPRVTRAGWHSRGRARPPPAPAAAQTPQNSNKNAETALNLLIHPVLVWSVKGTRNTWNLQPACLSVCPGVPPEKFQTLGAGGDPKTQTEPQPECQTTTMNLKLQSFISNQSSEPQIPALNPNPEPQTTTMSLKPQSLTPNPSSEPQIPALSPNPEPQTPTHPQPL